MGRIRNFIAHIAHEFFPNRLGRKKTLVAIGHFVLAEYRFANGKVLDYLCQKIVDRIAFQAGDVSDCQSCKPVPFLGDESERILFVPCFQRLKF